MDVMCTNNGMERNLHRQYLEFPIRVGMERNLHFTHVKGHCVSNEEISLMKI